MASEKQTEACGRCSMSTVVDAVSDGDGSRDPFADERIEVEESEFARVSPAVRLARLKSRLDAFAHRVTYGRRTDDRSD